MSREPEHPLIIHAVIAILAGLVGIAWGGYSIATTKKEEPPPATTTGPGGAAGAAKAITDTERGAQQTSSDAQRLAQKPTSASDAVQKAQMAAKYVGKLSASVVFLVVGIAGVAAGVFVFQKKDWARGLAFGAIAAVVLAFAAILGPTIPDAIVAWKLAVLGVGALVGAFACFGLMTEQFEGGAGGLGIVCLVVPLLAGGVGAPIWVAKTGAGTGAGTGTGTAKAGDAAKGGGEAGKGKEQEVDKYSWKRVGKGSVFEIKVVSEVQGLPEPFVSFQRYTLLDIDDKIATVKFESLDKDGNVQMTNEQKIDLTAKGGEGETETLERKTETIKVPAGEYKCDYTKSKVKAAGQEIVSETWLNPDFPGQAIVKLISGGTKMELTKADVKKK